MEMNGIILLSRNPEPLSSRTQSAFFLTCSSAPAQMSRVLLSGAPNPTSYDYDHGLEYSKNHCKQAYVRKFYPLSGIV